MFWSLEEPIIVQYSTPGQFSLKSSAKSLVLPSGFAFETSQELNQQRKIPGELELCLLYLLLSS